MLNKLRGKGEPPPDEAPDSFFRADEFKNLGQQIWNPRAVMRQSPQSDFALLGIILAKVRPWKQTYDSYSVAQLKCLREMLKPEVEAIEEALVRKVE